MMAHPEETVRLLAATWVLKFDPVRAVPVLESLARLDQPNDDGTVIDDILQMKLMAEAALSDWRQEQGLANPEDTPLGVDREALDRPRDTGRS